MTTPSTIDRSAGILLHPTSLPGPYGIGDLGPAAYGWIESLARAGQKWWQVLPLGPTSYGDSPYQALSTFAGNTNLVSPETLLHEGLLDQADLANVHFPNHRVLFEHVIQFKDYVLGKAWQSFQAGRGQQLRGDFDHFRHRNHAAWLDDFALFRALKDAHANKTWQAWPIELVRREPQALAAAREKLRGEIDKHCFGQFLFNRQWRHLKSYAKHMSVRLIGDVPIFVASDSADVWANPDLFHLDDQRRPTVVAGVPPDYFSATGQLWGNPLYNWDRSRETGHAWWIARLRATLEQVDLVRVDHFRGFEAYWEIPAGAQTAQHGRWVHGPGFDFFDVVRNALGRLPLIAEDLGFVTPEVESLRDRLGLPGMRVLQFAFSDTTRNAYLPHNYVHNTVVYTGTHDNDTTVGWHKQATDKERGFLHRYVPNSHKDVARELIRLAWASVADLALAPLQDVLNLGTEARMNSPGKPAGNWEWRVRGEQLHTNTLDWLGDVTGLYGR
ncbi:MAG TPA: 4-alpha-glucanotransferase [Gemmataceae bacterium]|nr:4-alpha-glucanotransferase [Gemmataceae bacterium]